MPNGLVFECHLNTVKPNHLNNGQMDAILFSYVLVQYSNGQSSTQDIALYQPFEIRTSKSSVFKWSVFRSLLQILKGIRFSQEPNVANTVGIPILYMWFIRQF